MAKIKKETKALTIPPIVQSSQTLKIVDAETMNTASETLSKLNTLAKKIKAERELITKPMNEALAEVRGRYKPTEDAIANAITKIRGEMTSYQTEQDRLEEIEKQKI